MMTLVCVEELAVLRQVEQERRLARMVLLAEARRPKATSPALAPDVAPIGRSAEPVRHAMWSGPRPGLAGLRRGLGRKLIATGQRLAGA